MIAGPSNAPYNPRYRDHTTGWIPAEGYHDQHVSFEPDIDSGCGLIHLAEAVLSTW